MKSGYNFEEFIYNLNHELEMESKMGDMQKYRYSSIAALYEYLENLYSTSKTFKNTKEYRKVI